jgi:hypothetical protein
MTDAAPIMVAAPTGAMTKETPVHSSVRRNFARCSVIGLIATFGLVACGSDNADQQDQPPATEAMMEETPSTEAMMEETPSTEAMMEETPSTEAMMEESTTP